MQTERGLSRSDSIYKKISFELFIEASIFLIFMSFLILMNKHSNLFFHTTIELFMNIIFIIVFVVIINTFSINKNSFLLIFGTGYFFVGVIGILHLLTYTGMPFLRSAKGFDVAIQLYIASRYVGSFTALISVALKYKSNIKINPFALFIAYLCLTAIFISSIFFYRNFPSCFIVSSGPTLFKVISEFINSIVFMAAAIIYFRLRKDIERSLFIYVECFLIMSIVSGIFLTGYTDASYLMSIAGHVINAFAAYFLYKGVVVIGLKRPYDIINHDLDVAGSKVKEFENILYSNEECSDFIINNSNDAIVVVCENKFVFANNKIAKLVGAESPDDIIGLEVGRLIPDEVKEGSTKRINSAFNSKKGIPYTESKLLRFDGQAIEVEVTNCYFLYHKKPAILAMFRDIRLQKQIMRLENDIIEEKKIVDKTTKLNKMLTEFFSNISHELKTPLNVILGAIQILQLPSNEPLNNSTELRRIKYLNTMKQNCFRLLRLVNNVIDLSKFDSGYFKLNLKNYDIVNVVEDITLSVADFIKHKGIEVIFDTDVEEKTMAVDVDKIERVILNLLSNSIKFTDKGGQILVSLLERGESILISIKDTGVGIPADKLDVIFERFGQVDKTLSRNCEGSGIGLSLVKSIVEMHDGNIKVLSKPSEGSEFIIELPVRLSREKEIVSDDYYESKVEKISIEFSDIYS